VPVPLGDTSAVIGCVCACPGGIVYSATNQKGIAGRTCVTNQLKPFVKRLLPGVIILPKFFMLTLGDECEMSFIPYIFRS